MLQYQLGTAAALLFIAALVWRNHRDYRVPGPRSRGEEAPLVSILVPARNEAANIEACLAGLLAQDYPHFEVVVLDDGSTDDTAARVLRLASGSGRLRLERGVPLPHGWAGKTHACRQLAQRARGDWLLFVDADTRHAPELLSRAMGEAVRTEADLLSAFPRQEIGTPGEALTVPFIYWVLFTLLPLRFVWERPEPAFTAACGQFLLARREPYFASGGHGAAPWSLHDGLHLARRFKREGRRVRLADLSPWISCRMYRGLRECWNGFSRNAFQAIGSLPALAFMTLVQAQLFLAPFVFLVWGMAAGAAWVGPVGAQVLLLLGIQASLRRRFGYPWLSVLGLPAGILLLIAIQWRSAWLSMRGGIVEWKGRSLRTAG